LTGGEKRDVRRLQVAVPKSMGQKYKGEFYRQRTLLYYLEEGTAIFRNSKHKERSQEV